MPKISEAPPEKLRGKILENLEQEKSVTLEDYKSKLKDYQIRLLAAQSRLRKSKRSVLVVVEGPDAAGKGGAIKRLVEKLDPRTVRVYSVVKPTEVELQHHYLWRFWTRVPGYGQFTVFDRSWYGRVLVERVEGFVTTAEWKRAYREINETEQIWMDDGVILIKFFLQITKEEQLRRFKVREGDPLKNWKISDEDWRNRGKWNEHIEAAEEMFERTSTDGAPWHVMAANYKWYARLKLLRTVVQMLEKSGL